MCVCVCVWGGGGGWVNGENKRRAAIRGKYEGTEHEANGTLIQVSSLSYEFEWHVLNKSSISGLGTTCVEKETQVIIHVCRALRPNVTNIVALATKISVAVAKL